MASMISWKQTPLSIALETEKIIKRSRKVYDAVGNLKPNELNYQNVIQALADNDQQNGIGICLVKFPRFVSADKDLRKASSNCDKKLSHFEVETSMRQDVFDNLVAYQAKNEKMGSEAQRYLERLILKGRRNGLHLPKHKQAEIELLVKRIAVLSIDHQNNMAREKTLLTFTEKELDGLSPSFLQNLEKTGDGKFKVSLKDTEYEPCMRKVKNPDTRKQLEFAYSSRCQSKNTKILEELVKLRAKKAAILGYSTHADFVTEVLMSGSSANVKKFLGDLTEKLKPLRDQELATMLKLKKEESTILGFPYDAKIHNYDRMYYQTMIKERDYGVDHQKLREYFPLDVVIQGMFMIYQDFLSLKFEQIANPDVWHPDVTMYSVKDATTQAVIGHFYMDLHSRAGKFGSNVCVGLVNSSKDSRGQRTLPLAAMMTSFKKPSSIGQSILSHEEVKSFLHEFGHAMHQICTLTEFYMFGTFATERDFLEAPSQMFENWAWEKKSLAMISQHYKDKTPPPSDLIDALIKSRQANAGILNLFQVVYNTFDQQIHSSKTVDTTKLIAEIMSKVLNIELQPGTNPMAAFQHMVIGYDAAYYSYFWSEVFAMDMFDSHFKKDILNAQAGGLYRKTILQPGGSVDATQMLKNFLGREPNNAAFLASKGLGKAAYFCQGCP